MNKPPVTTFLIRGRFSETTGEFAIRETGASKKLLFKSGKPKVGLLLRRFTPQKNQSQKILVKKNGRKGIECLEKKVRI